MNSMFRILGFYALVAWFAYLALKLIEQDHPWWAGLFITLMTIIGYPKNYTKQL